MNQPQPQTQVQPRAPLSFMRRHMTDGEIAIYEANVARMSDDDLVIETRSQIRAAGYDRTYGIADQKVSLCYAELMGRRREDLYVQAYRGACRDVGVED